MLYRYVRWNAGKNFKQFQANHDDDDDDDDDGRR